MIADDLPPMPAIPGDANVDRVEIWNRMQAWGQQCFAAGVAMERERAARLCEMTAAEIRMMAGEMSAGELRAVRAVLENRAAEIRKGE